ncbi:MAG: twin-arginine translocase TatA/TatE family subunit [Verrucomicrobia bacterium]|nr:twin-arginine translocase TatA/TatE family subunit [Verrucomicrobiota bacterium]
MDPVAFITPGPTEWLLILAIVLLLFGAKKLPELARGLAQRLNEFRKARDDFDRALQHADVPARPSIAPAGAPPRRGRCRTDHPRRQESVRTISSLCLRVSHPYQG